MLLVTVGTTVFDELVERVDQGVGSGEIAMSALLQIGNRSAYTPKHCKYVTIVSTLVPFYHAADLVVGHGGTGTTVEVLMLGKPLISVANPAMQDNHQVEFLNALEEMGLVRYCRDLAQLPTMIEETQTQAPQIRPGHQLAAVLTEEFQNLRRRPKRRGWLTRLADRITARWAVDVAGTQRSEDADSSVWEKVRTPSPAST